MGTSHETEVEYLNVVGSVDDAVELAHRLRPGKSVTVTIWHKPEEDSGAVTRNVAPRVNGHSLLVRPFSPRALDQKFMALLAARPGAEAAILVVPDLSGFRRSEFFADHATAAVPPEHGHLMLVFRPRLPVAVVYEGPLHDTPH